MIIDILFAVLIIMALIKGYTNGLVIAIFSVIALLVGLAAAIKLSTVVAEYLKHSVNISTKWLPVISFILVFLAAVLLVRMAAAAIQKTLELVLLGWLNRLGGIILYVFLYTIIFSVVLFYCEKVHILSVETINHSNTYHFIQPLGPKAIDTLGRVLPFFKDMFHELEAFFGTVSSGKN
ncbi:MAG: CvpA family protein [Chitinophagaceae bacterium]